MTNTPPRPTKTEDVHSELPVSDDNAPEASQKAKHLVPRGMKVLKCNIAEQTHHDAKVFAVTQRMNFGEAVNYVLSKGLAPAPSNEEKLAKSLQNVDRLLFDRVNKIRSELRLSWYQILRQALVLFEKQVNESATPAQRPAAGGGSLPPAPRRPSINASTVGDAASPRIRPTGYPGVGVTDASDSDMDESGTRPTQARR